MQTGFSQSREIDSLRSLLRNNKKNDTITANLFIVIGTQFYSTNPDSSSYYWEKAEKYCQNALTKTSNVKIKLNLLNRQAEALGNLGTYTQQKHDLLLAQEYYKKALLIYEQTGDKVNTAVIFSNVGVIFQELGDVRPALDYFMKALRAQELAQDSLNMATTLNNIGNIHISQNDTVSGRKFYNSSLEIRKKLKDVKGVAYSYLNIGATYKRPSEFDTALYFYKKSLEVWESIGDLKISSYCYNNIGALYFTKNDMKSATGYYTRCLNISRQIGDKRGTSNSLSTLSSVFYVGKDFDKADKFAREALALAKEVGYPLLIKNAAERCYRAARAKAQYERALEMKKLFVIMSDSLNNIANKKAFIRSQLKYEYGKKAATDSIKNQEEQKIKDAQLALQQTELKQKKTQSWFLISGLVFVLAGLMFAINRFKVTQHQKRIIEAQKIKVDQAFEQLHEKNKEVMDSIHYARRIQRALITNEIYIEKSLERLSGNT